MTCTQQLSEAGANSIRKAHAVTPLSTLQSEYSIWFRNLEDEIIPVLDELKIGLVPFSPLGKGFLTGQYNAEYKFDEKDFRNILPRFTIEARKANQAIVDLLK